MVDNLPIELLLVEDNPADVRLAREALRDATVAIHLTAAGDGVEALALLRNEGEYAHSPRPDMVLLDLNLPRLDGHKLLEEIKADPSLKSIPVVVLTTSSDPLDILNAYELGASFYVTKPPDLDDFMETMRWIEGFCLSLVKLPPRPPLPRNE